MLFHPSHLNNQHFSGLEKIAKWINFQDDIEFHNTEVEYEDERGQNPIIENENLERRFNANEKSLER